MFNTGRNSISTCQKLQIAETYNNLQRLKEEEELFESRNKTIYVTGFGKTDHIVTIDISRNTDLKHRSHHGSLVLDCSHARFAV